MTGSLDQALARRPVNGARVPPHDLDAERSLLGAMLLDRRAIDTAEDVLDVEDFYKPAHSHIFDHIRHLHAAGEPVDTVTVAETLGRAAVNPPEEGWLSALMSLQADTPATSSAGRYARIVADRALLRRLISAAGEIAELGYSLPDDIPATVDQAEQALYQAAGHQHTAGAIEPVSDVIMRALETIGELCETGGATGVPTGFTDLDHYLLGLHPGQLVTVAGRPSMGKTAFGTQLAINAATAGHHTLFGTVEMSTDEIALRLLASESKVTLQSIRAGRVAERDWPRLTDTASQIGQARLWFYDAATATVGDLRKAVRQLAARDQLHLVIVDYLQLMQVDDRRDNRQVDVSQISAALKRLAREFRIPVVALAQLSRSCEMRSDKRPVLSDLRESGAIENDSDVVIGIYRDKVYNPDTADDGVAELIIMKQRSGPTGTVRVAWLDQYTRFADMARA